MLCLLSEMKKLSSFASDDLNSSKTQLWVTVTVCLLFVGIGVPVWWKTTEVYRAVLPYDAISDLEYEKTITLKMFVEVINTISNFKVTAMSSDLNLQLNKQESNSPVKFLYEVAAEDNFEYDLKTDINSVNTIKLVLVVNDADKTQIKVTNKRIVVCSIGINVISELSSLQQLTTRIGRLVKDIIVNEKTVIDAVASSYEKIIEQKQNDLLRKAIKTGTKFELLFTLLCPNPEEILAEWDIDDGLSFFFQPMINKLKPVFSFHSGSQILYYTKIPYHPRQFRDGSSTTGFYFTQNQLSHVVNPIETKLGSQLSSNPTLNFAVYVVEKKHMPLYIRKKDKSVSQTNSFLVPRWGAMTLYNIENMTRASEISGTVQHSINMNKVMAPFVGHFRTLIGVSSFTSHLHKDVEFESPDNDGVSDWELDYLMRLRTVENVASSVHTLNSLSKLLSQISNIVINDDVAKEVYAAVDAITTAKKSAGAGNLTDAISFSKLAFVASETAFFDPTLLELLYFPEDQKFAIYVPLFLPVSLPLLLSILKTIKRLKSKEKSKTE